MTVREFLTTTKASRWYECHWSLLPEKATVELAREWFEKRGLVGAIYPVPFGFWLVKE